MHPILRRTALAATALLFASSAALAQANGWPKQPITLIMGFPAGSGVDVVARAVQEPLGQKLGQPIVIDYKSGAAGNIASEYVAHAKPDGYTLAFGTAATHGSNAALYKSGKVRLLGITTAKPVDAVKEVPTTAASGLPGTKGFDSSIWFGIFAPKGTDHTVVNKLNTALRQVLERPEIRQRFESQGNTVRIETPEQFRQTVRKDRAKWAQVVKDAKISIN